MPACRCQFCPAPLEPVQEFRYLVETAALGDPGPLALARTLPAANGRPLRVCRRCQDEFAAQPGRFRVVAEKPARVGLLAAAGMLSLGFVLAAVLGDV